MIAPGPNAAGSEKPDILTNIVAEILAAGATEFEVEYKNGEEQVFVMRGPVGFGIASFPSSSDEAQELRAQLYGLKKKRKKISVAGTDYTLQVEIFDSFGEDAFRVSITQAKR